MERVSKTELVKTLLEEMKAKDEVITVEDIDKLIKMMDIAMENYHIEKKYGNSDAPTLPEDIQRENLAVLDEFYNAKILEGKSEGTLYNYKNEVKKMFDVIKKHYSDITSADIRTFMQVRKETDNLQDVSVANIRMYLKSFFKWLKREDYIDINPMDKIDVIKTEQKVIDTLSDEEAEIIRCACTSERDLAIIDMLSGSGMRVSELCGLNKSDVNFATKEIRVFGKGKKERTCFMTGKAKVHLTWYLESRTDDNEALFVTSKYPYKRITKNGVEYILRAIAKKSNIPTKRIYPHLYRKTLATNMLAKGADPSTIQNILGHKSVDTTLSVYCKIDKENIKNEHKKYVG